MVIKPMQSVINYLESLKKWKNINFASKSEFDKNYSQERIDYFFQQLLQDNHFDFYELIERASIIEFDAGLEKNEAELLALDCVLKIYKNGN
jgi:hypothetical protein